MRFPDSLKLFIHSIICFMHQDIIENFCSLEINVHRRPAQFCNQVRHMSIHMIIKWFIVYNINARKVFNKSVQTSYQKGYNLHHTTGLQSISSALTPVFPSGLTSLFTVVVSCTSRGYSLCTGLQYVINSFFLFLQL